MDPRPLSIVVLLFGLLTYVGAVSGLLFASPTPPADVGALSTLVLCALFGVFGFLIVKRSKIPA
jgi:hypothetical protein